MTRLLPLWPHLSLHEWEARTDAHILRWVFVTMLRKVINTTSEAPHTPWLASCPVPPPTPTARPALSKQPVQAGYLPYLWLKRVPLSPPLTVCGSLLLMLPKMVSSFPPADLRPSLCIHQHGSCMDASIPLPQPPLLTAALRLPQKCYVLLPKLKLELS